MKKILFSLLFFASVGYAQQGYWDVDENSTIHFWQVSVSTNGFEERKEIGRFDGSNRKNLQFKGDMNESMKIFFSNPHIHLTFDFYRYAIKWIQETNSGGMKNE